MPETVRIGNSGPTVLFLQIQLNLVRPDLHPPLVPDGIFGPKTQARVMEFQRDKGLEVDGIVGPKTWAALLEPRAPVIVKPIKQCGNCQPENRGLGLALAATSAPLPPGAAFSRRTALGFLPSIPAKRIVPIMGTPSEIVAFSVYGNSLDYSTIFMSESTGLGNRPFTMLQPSISPFGLIQVMHLGTLNPGRDLLIHELAHVWQSQHHTQKDRFMFSSIESQKKALSLNATIAAFDPSVRDSAKGFPFDFPMSCYGYVPGDSFETYGVEQIAQQVEHGRPPIVAHVSAKPPGHDKPNEQSLELLNIVDRRLPGVV